MSSVNLAMSLHRSRRIPQLDGLRGLAILLVVCQHHFGFLRFFSFGWSGIDLFFVLSGYLITGRLLANQHAPGYFSHFYRNRALRILPLYYGTLIIFFIAVLFLVKKDSLPSLSFYTTHWKSFFLFTQNWTFIVYGVPATIVLLHFWSLAIEEQFYLVWPALVFLLTKRSLRLIICLAIPPVVIITRLVLYFSHPGDGHRTAVDILFNTFCRIDSFAIGALLCELHHARIKIPDWIVNLALAVSVAAITISLFIFGNLAPTNAFFATIGTTCIAMIAGALLHKSLADLSLTARFFNTPILRFFGKISYGLYIIHFPIFLLLYSRIVNWGIANLHWKGLAMQVSASVTCLLIALFLSVLSFRYYESFFLRLKRP
jgi:peptidoglycan/LPS O-acetylase OafA/YrhL